jgi:hypothetical protein
LALMRRERTPPESTVDPTQDPSVVRTVMSRSVMGMQVYCFDGAQWLEVWDAALPLQDFSSSAGGGQSNTVTSGSGASTPAGLPQAVQVKLTFAPGSIVSRGAVRNQSATPDLPLNVVVAMPGAEEQTLQEEQTSQTTGGSGG